MKNLFQIVLISAMAAAPSVWATPVDDEQGKDHLTVAHEELREAVEKIRAYHAAGDDFTFARDMWSAFRRPRLGLLLKSDPVSADRKGEPGAVVEAVTPGSPADEAGLLAGDVIIRFNGQLLVEQGADDSEAWSRAAMELVRRSRELEEGDSVTLEYLRDDSIFEATLIARELEASAFLMRDFSRPFDGSEGNRLPTFRYKEGEAWFVPFGWLDMELVALNPGLGEYFGSDVGVLVVRGPEAGDLGLESGDVILSIGGREVRSPEHAMRILRSYEPDEMVLIDIIRHGSSETLSGTLPKSRSWSLGNTGSFSHDD